MFQVTTGDDWAAVTRRTTDVYPAAWLFFILYIVLSTYIVLNLFIAVAVEALDRETEEDRAELKEEVEEIGGGRAGDGRLDRRRPRLAGRAQGAGARRWRHGSSPVAEPVDGSRPSSR